MQKQLVGYTIDPKGYELVFNKDKFIEDLKLTGAVWYESYQIFDWDTITKYKSIVIFWAEPKRVADVLDIYRIEPSEVRVFNEETHYVFNLTSAITIARFNRLGKNLAEIYQASYQHFGFFKESCSSVTGSWKFLQEWAANDVFEFQPLADTVNESEEIMFNSVPIETVAKKLRYDGAVDSVLNIAPWLWAAFNLAVYVLGWMTNAMVWCNKYFDHNFITEDAEVSKYIVEWILVKHNSIIESNGGYKLDNGKNLVEITDFLISVHYQLVKADGENVYVVSIIPRQGKRVEHVEWKNTSSDTSLGDFLMRMGSFHIGWSKLGVKAMHEMITSSRVPIIHTRMQYGANVYKGQDIIIAYDGVFDMATKKMFPKNDKFWFYFIGGNDGIMISSDAEAWKIQKEFVPRLTKVGEYKYEDYYNVTKTIYKNSTAHVLLMFACSMAGVALYHKWNKTPSYYVTWVTGTGKSSFAECLYTMFWVSEPYGLRNSTAYPVKTSIAAFNRLPVFFNEFRSDMKYASEKLGYIQMAYDNSTTSKWLRSGGTLSYKMSSQVFCEGEDTYDEGSIRTRSILHTLTRAGTTAGCIPKNIINDNRNLFESFFWTYCTHTSIQDYQAALKDTAIFYKRWIEPRISDNISIMYAGCMAFAPEMKDIFIRECMTLVDSQVEDFHENGESQKMLKILAEYYGNKYCNVYIEQGYLYIDWTEITTYIDRFKRNLTLSIWAYSGHMEALGFEKEFYEVQCPVWEWEARLSERSKVINWFRMPLVDLPKNLLNNQRIFSEYNKAIKLKK